MVAQYYNNYSNTTNFSDTTVRLTLTAGNAQSVVLPVTPNNSYQVLFEYASNANVFVGLNSAATVPAPNAQETGGKVEFKPCKRFAQGGDTLSFITPDATAYVGISIRSLG